MEDLTPEARAAVADGKTLYADSIESLVSVTLVSFFSVCAKPRWHTLGGQMQAGMHRCMPYTTGRSALSRPVRMLWWLRH